MPFIPHTEHDIQAMLATIGVNGLQDLFAEIPENPSDPPHFNPTTSLLSGAGARSILFASTKPKKVFCIAWVSSSCSVPDCC